MFRLSARGPNPTTGPLHHLGSGGGADRRRVGTRLALGEDAERVLARDLAEARAYVAHMTQGDNYAWAIVADDCDTDEAVGVVAFSVDEENRNAWFFYWLHPEYRGRGLTARAARAAADWALGPGGLYRLELGHRVNNPASGGVARAAGFVQEGVEREKFLINGERVDVYTYGRLASD